MPGNKRNAKNKRKKVGDENDDGEEDKAPRTISEKMEEKPSEDKLGAVPPEIQEDKTPRTISEKLDGETPEEKIGAVPPGEQEDKAPRTISEKMEEKPLEPKVKAVPDEQNAKSFCGKRTLIYVFIGLICGGLVWLLWSQEQRIFYLEYSIQYEFQKFFRKTIGFRPFAAGSF